MMSSGQLQSVLWDTATVAEPLRLDYWIEAITRTHGELACDPIHPGDFVGSLSTVQVGAITVSQSRASARRVQSLARHESLYLVTDSTQAWTYCQQGVTQRVEAGDVAIVDGTTPWRSEFPRPTQLTVVAVPLVVAGRWIPEVHSPQPRVASGEKGWSRVLAAMCSELGSDIQLAANVAPEFLEASMGQLLAACLWTPPAACPPAHGVVERATKLMTEQIDVPGLSVEELAGQLYISPRTLHRNFAAVGESVGARLRRLRLDRASELLANPRLLSLRVEEIARRSGFVSASHFSREFRRAHGTTPLLWRASRHDDANREARLARQEDLERRIEEAMVQIEAQRNELERLRSAGRPHARSAQLLAEMEQYLGLLRRARGPVADADEPKTSISSGRTGVLQRP